MAEQSIPELMDDILRFLQDGRTVQWQQLIDKFHNEKQVLPSLLHTLKTDDVIKGIEGTYIITGKGLILLRKGGYKGFHEDDETKKEYTKTLNKSIVDTNISTQSLNKLTSENIPFQRTISKRSFIIAVGSLIVAALSIVASWIINSQSSQENILKQQTSIMEQTLKVQSEINQSLKQIANFKIQTDTVNPK